MFAFKFAVATRLQEGAAMRVKAIAFVLILAVSAGVFMLMRGKSRADAAAGDCYADAAGPATPTICG